MVFIIGVVFGATVAEVTRYIERRRRSELDYRLLMTMVRAEAASTARDLVASMVPLPSERKTLNLKPHARRVITIDGPSHMVEPPDEDRPTHVHVPVVERTWDDQGDG